MTLAAFLRLNFSEITADVLANIENIVGDSWDEVKNEKCVIDAFRAFRVNVTNVTVDVKQKTLDLGYERNESN